MPVAESPVLEVAEVEKNPQWIPHRPDPRRLVALAAPNSRRRREKVIVAV